MRLECHQAKKAANKALHRSCGRRVFCFSSIHRPQPGERRRSAIDTHMNDWPDTKIYNNAIWYIKRHLMSPETWRFTRIENYHTEVLDSFVASEGERAVVTAMTSERNWYALTTRRLIGCSSDGTFDIPAHTMTDCRFGSNPKGYSDVELSIATIFQMGTPVATFEFETGKAWMAPEYYATWWVRKFKLIDVLKFDPASR